jgi:hypothetical protein
MRLHRDHRWIDARHASRTTARQWSCRPRSNRLALVGAFMPAHTLRRRRSKSAAGSRSLHYFIIRCLAGGIASLVDPFSRGLSLAFIWRR